MKFLKTFFISAIFALTVACGSEGLDVDPDKNYCNVVLPWPVGGSTGKAWLAVEDEIRKGVGKPVHDIELLGDNGLAGTKAAMNTPADCVMVFNALQSVVEHYPIDGLWLYTVSKNVAIISVGADSDYKDPDKLIEALDTGILKIATAGANSGGDIAANAAMKVFDNKDHKIIHEKGGADAVLSVADGRNDVTMQYANEIAKLVKDGDLIPVFVFGNKSFKMGNLEIPPLSDYIDKKIPDLETIFGMALSKEHASKTIIGKLNDVWVKIDLEKEAQKNSTKPFVSKGIAAADALMQEIEVKDWALKKGE